MYLCYMDESGTSSIPGNTSHFVLAGLAIPASKWKFCEDEIKKIKKRYFLENAEIHTGWMLRTYLEESKIPEFRRLNFDQRRREIMKLQNENLYHLRKTKPQKASRQARKNQRETADYIHLTYNERCKFIQEVANCIASWDFARLFAEAINKPYFITAQKDNLSVDDQAFEQIVSRFGTYLNVVSEDYGLLIHDNNQTVSKRHTDMMKRFHERGETRWTRTDKIIETPLFVDSQLTSMVQIADLCAYALRRYLENSERKLFDFVFKRADRKDGVVVGVRHFADRTCNCRICKAHSKS